MSSTFGGFYALGRSDIMQSPKMMCIFPIPYPSLL